MTRLRHVLGASIAACLALLGVSTAFAAAATASPVVFAHRGDHDHRPENSLGAFKAAGADGITHWETDIRFTRDGVAVLMHDENVARTTNCAGLVSAKTSRHLARKCRLDGGGRIPTLAKFVVLARHYRAFSQVEFKTIPTAKQRRSVLAIIGARVTLISRYPQALRKLGATKTCLLLASPAMTAGPTIDCVSVHYVDLTAEEVVAFHAAGQRVIVWTPNTWIDWLALIALGVNGLVTDEADILAAHAATP